jgi:hypothetical protein
MLEYSELFLFLLVAMTYIEAMRERNVFEALKVWLTNKGLGKFLHHDKNIRQYKQRQSSVTHPMVS